MRKNFIKPKSSPTAKDTVVSFAAITQIWPNLAVKYARTKAKYDKGAGLGRQEKQKTSSPRKGLWRKTSKISAIRRVAHIVWAPKLTFCAVKFEKAATPHGKSPLAVQILAQGRAILLR